VYLAAYLPILTGWQLAPGAEPSHTSTGTDGNASPIFGLKIPVGYRHWELIAPSQEIGRLDELRVIVGNGQLLTGISRPNAAVPDGTILVKLAWTRLPSSLFAGAFVLGAATTARFMVKNSRKYAATGGLGVWPLRRWKARRRGAAPTMFWLPFIKGTGP
jgi:hypothetical protein